MGYMGWGGGGGMGMGGGGGGGARRAALERLGKRKPNLKKLWPLIWMMLKPRLWVLAGGLGLTAVKVVASLTLPQISKRLIATVLNTRPPHPER